MTSASILARASCSSSTTWALKVLSVDPRTGASSVFMTVTGKNPGLDGLTFDPAGNVYVTDAHQGHHLEGRTRRRRGVGSGSPARC
ncbi:hypothetical protein ACU4GD_33695 [Cupriavidus basilensis]